MTTAVRQTDWVDQLVALLEEQHAIYVKFEQFSIRQSQLVQDGQTDELLSLLAQRQQLIDQLTLLNNRIEPYRERWSQMWTDLDEADQQRVRELIEQVQHLIEKIVDQDGKDRSVLQDRRDQLIGNISRVRQSGAAHRAYGQDPHDPQRARYTDQQG